MRKTDRRDEWRILCAATNFARSEFQDYLAQVFYNETAEPASKVMAAWGLAKLRQTQVYEYLVEMLDDPDISTPTSYTPGHSIRAAQAIADINGWDFEWDKSFVALIKSKIAKQRNMLELDKRS